MTKKQFFKELKKELQKNKLNNSEINNILNYYDEIFNDKSDEGLREDYIIDHFGTMDEIIAKIKDEQRERQIENKKMSEKKTATYTKKRFRWEILVIFFIPILIIAILCFTIVVVSISLVVVAFALAIGGLLSIIFALPNFGVSFENGTFALGYCFAVIGIGLVLIPATIKLTKAIFSGLSMIFWKKTNERRV